MRVVKVRLIGSLEGCGKVLNLITSQFPEALECPPKKVRRDPEKDPYSSTFGKAEVVYYLRLKPDLLQEVPPETSLFWEEP